MVASKVNLRARLPMESCLSLLQEVVSARPVAFESNLISAKAIQKNANEVSLQDYFQIIPVCIESVNDLSGTARSNLAASIAFFGTLKKQNRWYYFLCQRRGLEDMKR